MKHPLGKLTLRPKIYGIEEYLHLDNEVIYYWFKSLKMQCTTILLSYVISIDQKNPNCFGQ